MSGSAIGAHAPQAGFSSRSYSVGREHDIAVGRPSRPSDDSWSDGEVGGAAAEAAVEAAAGGKAKSKAFAGESLEAECTIDDFTKVDLRVAEIVSARAVPKANKLLELELSLRLRTCS